MRAIELAILWATAMKFCAPLGRKTQKLYLADVTPLSLNKDKIRIDMGQQPIDWDCCGNTAMCSSVPTHLPSNHNGLVTKTMNGW
jgi:hypothetical protein